MARNVHAPTEEECEQKLAELIKEMKKELGSFGSRKKRAENRKPPSGKAIPEGGDFSCLWLLCGQKQFGKIARGRKQIKKQQKTVVFSRKQRFFWWTIQDLNL